MNEFMRDMHVTFDAVEHKYHVRGLAMNTSVTSVVHQFFSKFNGQAVALNMIRGKKFWTDKEKYGK